MAGHLAPELRPLREVVLEELAASPVRHRDPELETLLRAILLEDALGVVLPESALGVGGLDDPATVLARIEPG